MSVSKATERALREAMARLTNGKPQRTDGALTKENLCKEAQASRATMNRATDIMAEWDAHIAARGSRTQGEARRDTELAELAKKLKAKNAENAKLRQKLEAAATVIAALHHDNQALREHLASRNQLADLDEQRTRRGPARGSN